MDSYEDSQFTTWIVLLGIDSIDLHGWGGCRCDPNKGINYPSVIKLSRNLTSKNVVTYANTADVWDDSCRKSKFLLIILGSKQYVPHGGLIYNLIQELGVSRLTQRDCPFRVETPTMQRGINAINTE